MPYPPQGMTGHGAAHGAIGGTTPAAGAFTTLSASDDITLGAAKHLVLPLHNDAATPTLAFGDGNTGFYESVDNNLNVSVGGTRRWQFLSSHFRAVSSSGSGLLAAGVSNTVPGVIARMDDSTTGLGLATDGQLSLIAGATEVMRLVKTTNEIYATIGLSTAKITLGTAGTPAFDIHTTTALTSGNSIAMEINHTRTVDSVSGRDWGLKVTMTSDSNKKFPGGVNAVYGSLALGTGGAHGRAGAVQGELVMPDGQLTRGTFSCLHADLTCSANTNWGSAGPLSFISCVVGGTKTFFEANAYLFEITGITEADGNMCDNGATPTSADGGIRCLINGAVRYLLYANDAEN